jgi:hypothetical protein
MVSQRGGASHRARPCWTIGWRRASRTVGSMIRWLCNRSDWSPHSWSGILSQPAGLGTAGCGPSPQRRPGRVRRACPAWWPRRRLVKVGLQPDSGGRGNRWAAVGLKSDLQRTASATRTWQSRESAYRGDLHCALAADCLSCDKSRPHASSTPKRSGPMAPWCNLSRLLADFRADVRRLAGDAYV